MHVDKARRLKALEKENIRLKRLVAERDELLNREVFETLLKAKVLVERWRREYNHIRKTLLPKVDPDVKIVYSLRTNSGSGTKSGVRSLGKRGERALNTCYFIQFPAQGEFEARSGTS